MYQNLCFVQKYDNSQKYSTENCHFYSCEKFLYVAWTCFCNVFHCIRDSVQLFSAMHEPLNFIMCHYVSTAMQYIAIFMAVTLIHFG